MHKLTVYMSSVAFEKKSRFHRYGKQNKFGMSNVLRIINHSKTVLNFLRGLFSSFTIFCLNIIEPIYVNGEE